MKSYSTVVKGLVPLGMLLAVMALSGQSKPQCNPSPVVPDTSCTTPKDCEGLPHVMCLGEWQCVDGECRYTCKGGGCHSDEDCPKGQHCSVSDGECGVDPACPMCDVCYGECVPDQAPCIQTGCSGEVCSDREVVTPCLYQDWFVCLKLTKCGRFGPGGTCAFEQTPEFLECLAKYKKCKVDTDCPKGYACVDGKCQEQEVLECKDDSDCPKGFYCDVQTICPPCVEETPPCLAPCILKGECKPKPEGCKSDADCAWYEYCAFPMDACCPPKAFCIPEIPPCGEGVCLLRPGYCWSDADCKDGEHCEGVIPPCPPGAYCFAAPQPGKCVPNEPPCKAVKPGTHGLCEMVLGYIFDGQKCVLESGCSCEPDCEAFFKSAEACEEACIGPLPCYDDSDCPEGEVCVWSGGCPPCDCDPSQGDCVCPMCMPPEHGYCKPASGCTSDKDCDDGDKCTVDKCVISLIGSTTGVCEHEYLPGCGWCTEDKDGDGYFGGFCYPYDCDDNNPAVHPDAKEVCDGIDNDCDGQVDEDGCGGSYIPCTNDSQCPSGYVCDKSGCLSCCPDLKPGEVCIDMCCGRCVPAKPECKSNSDCSEYEYCDPTGICKLQPGYCWSDKDCKEGEHCEGAIICPPGAMCLIADRPGKCVKPSYIPCTGNSQCPSGQVCDTTKCLSCCPDLKPGEACIALCCGQCVPEKPECLSDDDCPVGEYCALKFDSAGELTGKCEKVPEGMCVRDADCGKGGKCHFGPCPLCYPCPCFGKCVKECWSDADCPDGFFCNILKCGGSKCPGPYECLPL